MKILASSVDVLGELEPLEFPVPCSELVKKSTTVAQLCQYFVSGIHVSVSLCVCVCVGWALFI